MVQTVILPGLIGVVWGFAVSLFNDFWAWRAINRPKGISLVLLMFRQGINILAMFAVYKNVPMLIGTAIGLLLIKNYILVKEIYVEIFKKKFSK